MNHVDIITVHAEEIWALVKPYGSAVVEPLGRAKLRGIRIHSPQVLMEIAVYLYQKRNCKSDM